MGASRRSFFRRLVLASALLAVAAASRAGACDLTVAEEVDPPYTLLRPDGNFGGVDPDVVAEVLRRIGCKASFVEMPFARGLASLQDGSVAVLPNVFRTRDREEFAYFSAPYNTLPNLLFIRHADRDRWKIAKLADLVGTQFRLGVEIGAIYGVEYRRLQDDPAFRARLVPVTDALKLWGLLEMGRIDGVLSDQITGHWQLKEAGLDGTIEPQGLVVSVEPGYITFSRKAVDQDFVDRFDRTLAELRRDGTMAEILERYGLPRSALTVN